jgi:hypothetical protein
LPFKISSSSTLVSDTILRWSAIKCRFRQPSQRIMIVPKWYACLLNVSCDRFWHLLSATYQLRTYTPQV